MLGYCNDYYDWNQYKNRKIVVKIIRSAKRLACGDGAFSRLAVQAAEKLQKLRRNRERRRFVDP